MTLYQVVIPAIALLFMVSALSRFVGGKQSFRELLLWIMFWGSFAFIAIYPKTLDQIARILGVETGLRALFFISTLFLFFSVLQLFLRLERLQEQLTEFVRHEALADVENRFEKFRSEKEGAGDATRG